MCLTGMVYPASQIRNLAVNMLKVVLVSDGRTTGEIGNWLIQKEIKYTAIEPDEILDVLSHDSFGLVILDLHPYSKANSLARIIKDEKQIPVLLMVPDEQLSRVILPVEADDFAVSSALTDELYLRIRRLMPGNDRKIPVEQIDCGDLVIDLASCEVTLKGEPLDLTFREYELLKFLASNRGRTFTREILLDRVWGYDYLGGDRTVDVHIRRLRTKTDTADCPYIETVRNIGYRFRK